MKNRGFGLIEVLIALSISMVGALALMTVTAQSLRSQLNVASINDFNNLQDRIKLFIRNPNLCPQTLGNKEIQQLNLADELVSVNSRLSSGSTITKLSIESLSPTGYANEYSAYLHLAGLKNPVALGPNILKEVTIPIVIVLDPNNNIIACNSTEINQLPPATNFQPNAQPSPTPNPITADYVQACAEMGGHWNQGSCEIPDQHHDCERD